MTSKTVTEPGYYNGKFLKAGMSYDDNGVEHGDADDQSVDLGKLTKDELIAEAQKRGIEVDTSKTKAEIIAAIEAGSV